MPPQLSSKSDYTNCVNAVLSISSSVLLSTLHVVANATKRLFAWFLVEPFLHHDALRVRSFHVLSACFCLSQSAALAVSPVYVTDRCKKRYLRKMTFLSCSVCHSAVFAERSMSSFKALKIPCQSVRMLDNTTVLGPDQGPVLTHRSPASKERLVYSCWMLCVEAVKEESDEIGHFSGNEAVFMGMD